MDVVMSRAEMTKLLQRFVEVGFMEAVRAYEPPADEIKRTELTEWLRFMGIERKFFMALLDAGHIKGYRKETHKNSTVYYSKAEIKAAIAKCETVNLMTRMVLLPRADFGKASKR